MKLAELVLVLVIRLLLAGVILGAFLAIVIPVLRYKYFHRRYDR